MQVFHAFVVSGLRADFTYQHYFISAYADWVVEPLNVPELE
jgi:hypothetical protein